jgi:rare lipoprotein A
MVFFRYCIVFVCLLALLGGCSHRKMLTKAEPEKPAPVVAQKEDTRPSYTIKGKKYYPLDKVKPGTVQEGLASWYGPGFNGKPTSSGETYDMHGLTAAHSTLPLGSVVRVTNMDNRKAVTVRINDRGPFVGDRVLDLSLGAAKKLEIVKPGTAPVRLTVLKSGDRARGQLAKKQKTTPQAPNPYYRNHTLASAR